MVCVVVFCKPFACDIDDVKRIFLLRKFVILHVEEKQLTEESLATNLKESVCLNSNEEPRNFPQTFFVADECDVARLTYFLTQNFDKDICILWNTQNLDNMMLLRDQRPFICTVLIDAPLLQRFQRHTEKQTDPLDIFAFVSREESCNLQNYTRFKQDMVIWNEDADACEQLLKADFRAAVRPSWDAYFMRMAFLAASRANCMKRKVGAVVSLDHRVIATGYNGTPRGLPNCNEGGCARCNNADIRGGEALHECLCIHAEENALLESGKAAAGGAMYCTTCPCLGCTKKIVQARISRLFYCDAFHTDEASLRLLSLANIEVQLLQIKL